MIHEPKYTTPQLLTYLGEQLGRPVSHGSLNDYIRDRRIIPTQYAGLGHVNRFSQSEADRLLRHLKALTAVEVAEEMTLRMGRNVSAKTIRDMFRRKVVPTISSPPRLETCNLGLVEQALRRQEKVTNSEARAALAVCQEVTELTRQQIAIICGVRVGTLDQIINDNTRYMSYDLYDRINGLIEEYSR